MEVQLHAFLTLALDGGKWLASCPGRLTPGTKFHMPIYDSSSLGLLRILLPLNNNTTRNIQDWIS